MSPLTSFFPPLKLDFMCFVLSDRIRSPRRFHLRLLLCLLMCVTVSGFQKSFYSKNFTFWSVVCIRYHTLCFILQHRFESPLVESSVEDLNECNAGFTEDSVWNIRIKFSMQQMFSSIHYCNLTRYFFFFFYPFRFYEKLIICK